MPHGFWTEKRLAYLKELWEQGLSSSQIGAALGTTRNAIIGKLHRLNLPLSGRAPPKETAAVWPRLRTTVTCRIRRVNQHKVVRLKEEEPEIQEVVPVDDLSIPVRQRCTLLDLTADTCRWPIGDPMTVDFFFCGAKPAPEKPYCAYHCSVAYQPASALRDWWARKASSKAA